MINKERVIGTFIELVAVPCPSKGEKQEAELLMQKLQALGIAAKIDDAGSKCGGSTGNVWAFLPGNVPGATRTFFEAHMDSVAPTTGTKVVRKEGVLYSDGTTTLGGDDKVGIAAVLEALQVLQEDQIPHGDIQACFTIGEEIGGVGIKNMDPSWLQADVGYCLDMGGKAGTIYNASPQMNLLTFTITGQAAHAGMEPEKGVNAIMLAAKALAKLPWYGRLDGQTTLNVDLIEGGLAENIVAERCQFVVDVRCPDTDKLETLIQETVQSVTATVQAGGGVVAADVKINSPAVFVKEEEPAVVLAKKAAANLGFPVRIEATGCCSDANYICGYGLPCVLLASGMDKIHTTKEQLAEEDLYNTVRWLVELIKVAAAK